MPFDSNQRWIPPNDNWRTGKYLVSHRHGWREADAAEIALGKAENKGGDKDSTYRGQMTWDQVFERKDLDTSSRGYDFRGLIESGLIGDLFPTKYDNDGNVDVNKTLRLDINTSQWNQADAQMRYDILRQYQDYYHGDDSIHWAKDGEVNVFKDGQWVKTKTITGFDADLREDLNWGLDIQREWYGENTENYKKWDDKSTTEIFQNLMGLQSDGTVLNKYFEHGSKSDYRYYNNHHQPILNAMRQHVFGDNYHQDYSTVKEVRDARRFHSELTLDERDRLASWASRFITPYKDHEANADDKDAWEFHKSMKFDTETNTMTYYDSIAGLIKEDINGNPVTRTIEPPAEPEVMDIRVGPTVQKLHDSDGNRIVNESSVNELYHRYLGRSAGQEGLNYWTNEGHSLDVVENYLRESPEGKANKAKWLDQNDKLYFNPQKYGSPESITARMRDEPAKIKAPSITIRNIGHPKKPTNLPSHWLTEAPVKIPAVTRDDTITTNVTNLVKPTLGAIL